MLPNEAQLIEAVRNGDMTSFGPIYDHYIEPLYRFLYFKTHHAETAEDLTSDVFAKALEHIDRFDNTPGNFRAWLYQIARNTVIDHYRRERRTTPIDDAWDLPVENRTFENTDIALHMNRLRSALEGLSADQRDVLVLRIWQQMSHAEIAAILGKTEANCKKLYSRAIAELKASLPEGAMLILALTITPLI